MFPTGMKISIVIPAHNEQNRIRRTLEHYLHFFTDLKKRQILDFEILVVLNACSDGTLAVVQEIAKTAPELRILDLQPGGKGFALAAGFADALTRDNDLISFVDADMATGPSVFYELIQALDGYGGVIASRYMAGSTVYPVRPWIKTWGRKIIYHGLIRLLYGLKYQDFQCGAKVFRRSVIATVTPHLTVKQWAFDLELLYLCKLYGFKIKETPTVWYDQADSKLSIMRGGLPMLGALFTVRWRHSQLRTLCGGK